mmetsp:Transcript_16452/g.18551  ORF Transcript_16452/g.18551 Transcript_16452/m.18551 type:complete len:120 (+) Transcript_16452:47-406(+)
MTEIDDTLKTLMSKEGVTGYIIINGDGIPVKYKNVEHPEAVHYAALVSDLVMKTQKSLKGLPLLTLNNVHNDNELTTIRLRTTKGTENIISVVRDYILVAIQRCVPVEEEEEEKQEGQP